MTIYRDTIGRCFSCNLDELDDKRREFLIGFVKRFSHVCPEAKDYHRAETCGSVAKAKSQLKRITDISKFYRRLKAFMEKGILIHDIKDTAFDEMNSEYFENWLKYCTSIMADKTIPSNKKNSLINEMAEMLAN